MVVPVAHMSYDPGKDLLSMEPSAMNFRSGAVCLVLACSLVEISAADDASKNVVATVNDAKITQADLDAEFLVRRIPADKQAQSREVVLNDLIDRRLIAEFLDSRKASVPEPELDARMDLLKRAVEAGKGSFAETLG